MSIVGAGISRTFGMCFTRSRSVLTVRSRSMLFESWATRSTRRNGFALKF
jgi:hypothetical protein